MSYLAYFQLNIDYIIQTYCVNKDEPELACNGNCHLTKMIAQKKVPKDDTQGALYITEAFFPVFHQFKNNDLQESLAFKIPKENNWKLISLYPINLTSRLEQPPDFTV
ncbi:MAG: hypothetical protein ABF250_10020 [Polaribacter sp.]|uniref:hypothetical protein n=1 Tax=Polaribacter sp. TaxID=1920175 RepID=UPI003219FE93